MIKVEVEAPQITPQIRKLKDFDRVARAEFTAAMRPAISLTLVDIHAWAPYQTGQLDSSVRGEIKFAMGEEVRGVMYSDARAKDGFPYGYALDASNKYRYAGGGKKTKGWLRGAGKRQKDAVLALFAAALERIVARLRVDGTDNGE